MIDSELTLWGLFISAFISSTLLPGGSEVVLAILGAKGVYDSMLLLAVATVGNTLGGMSSWGIGRLLAWRFPTKGLLKNKNQVALKRIQNWGSPVLLLSWVPVIGDPLCLAAGWLRVNWVVSLLFMATGKAIRYLVILEIVSST